MHKTALIWFIAILALFTFMLDFVRVGLMFTAAHAWLSVSEFYSIFIFQVGF